MEPAVAFDPDVYVIPPLVKEARASGDLMTQCIAPTGIMGKQHDAHGGPSLDTFIGASEEIVASGRSGRNAEFDRMMPQQIAVPRRSADECERCLIDVQVGSQFLEHLFTVFVPHHQIDPLTAVFAFEPFLRFAEEGEVALPRFGTTCPSFAFEGSGTSLPQTFEQFILEREEELAAANVALPTRTAG